MASVIRGSDNFDSLVHQGIGVNQSWQDVTASRASGVTYTNSAGKPIMVVITGNGATYQITVAGTLVASGNTSSTVTISTFIVQNGATYVVNLSGSLTKWAELR